MQIFDGEAENERRKWEQSGTQRTWEGSRGAGTKRWLSVEFAAYVLSSMTRLLSSVQTPKLTF